MIDKLELNPFCDIITKDEERGAIILKNRTTNALIRLSLIEYDIIRNYSASNDLRLVLQQYSQEYDLDYTTLNTLIGNACKFSLLINKASLEDATKKMLLLNRKSTIQAAVEYCLLFLSTWLYNLLGIRIKVEMRGNFRFYKILAIDIKDSVLERLSSNKTFQRVLGFSFCLSILIFLIVLIISTLLPVSFQYVIHRATLSPFMTILILMVAITLSYFIHEMGHYFIYKYFRGTTSEIGFAFLYVFLPVMYTSTDSMHLWTNKWRKIKVEMGGILMDIWIVLVLLFLLGFVKNFDVLFILYVVLIFVSVRLITNFNFFIPGTDGYYMVIDFLGKEKWYESIYEKVKRDYQLLLRGQLGSLITSLKETWYSHVYILTSWVFIFAYWLATFMALFLPYYIFLYNK